MTNSQRLAVRLSEIRQRLNTIAGLEGDAFTDEIRQEADKLQGEFKAAETQYRSALVAESDAEARAATDGEGAELRALNQLVDRVNLGRIFGAVLEHRATDGAEKEIQDHFKVASNQVPLRLLRVESRAVTPGATNVGQNQQPIIPGVFPNSVASFLGVDMPTVGVGEAVYPVLTTNADVKTPAENAAAAETTGSFSSDVLSPARLQASFFYSREDRARFSGMAESLRENLGSALSDSLDKQIVSGTNGLLTGTNLANHNASAQTDFAGYLSSLGYGRVDGEFAGETGELRLVLGSATYAHAGGVYRNSSVDRNVLDRLREILGGVRVSAHVPAASGTPAKQNTVVRLGMRRDMVAPIWQGVSLIPDEVTKAGTGQIVITAVMLHAVKILRAGGFYKAQTQHA